MRFKVQPHNANNSPVTGLTRPAFSASLTFSFAQSVPKHSVVERLPCFTREKMSRAINVPIFTPHPVCGWRCLSCQLGRWGECLQQQQQGGEGRVAPRWGRVSPRHRRPHCHSIPAQPHQRKHCKLYKVWQWIAKQCGATTLIVQHKATSP